MKLPVRAPFDLGLRKGQPSSDPVVPFGTGGGLHPFEDFCTCHRVLADSPGCSCLSRGIYPPGQDYGFCSNACLDRNDRSHHDHGHDRDDAHRDHVCLKTHPSMGLLFCVLMVTCHRFLTASQSISASAGKCLAFLEQSYGEREKMNIEDK